MVPDDGEDLSRSAVREGIRRSWRGAKLTSSSMRPSTRPEPAERSALCTMKRGLKPARTHQGVSSCCSQAGVIKRTPRHAPPPLPLEMRTLHQHHTTLVVLPSPARSSYRASLSSARTIQPPARQATNAPHEPSSLSTRLQVGQLTERLPIRHEPLPSKDDDEVEDEGGEDLGVG